MPYAKYVKLPGSERKPVPGATKTSEADPNAVIQVTVTLRPRSRGRKQPSVEELVASGKTITREEYAARYGADPADVQKVAEFAASFGLSVAQVSLPAASVVLTGRTGDFARAFQTDIACYEHAGGSYRGRSGTLSVPSELSKIILSVHGLDDRTQTRPQFRFATSVGGSVNPHAAGASLTPLQVARAYSFPSSADGSGQAIGIIELGGGFKQTDLATYFKGLGISPAPNVVAISVDGAQNQPTGDTSGPDTEVMLDIEVAGAVAPKADIVVYFAPNTDAGFLDAINQAVNDNVYKPSVISISWGAPESSWTAQSLQSYNSALQAAAAIGVTVCVACGDSGSTDGVSDGNDHVDFPSSSPYSLACGGTSLTLSGTNISSEVVWNDLSAGNGATGGGVSGTFALPSWQKNVNVPSAGFSGRGLPDVSGDADPNTGYQILADGSSIVVGGTSAVAPLWAGLIALLNQSLGKPVGYLNPPLYQRIAAQAGTFRDITSGNNGDYSAKAGWDACSGWGSPNGVALLQALSVGTTPTPTPTPTPPPPKPPPPKPPPPKPPPPKPPPKRHKPKPPKPPKRGRKPAPPKHEKGTGKKARPKGTVKPAKGRRGTR